MDRINTSNLPNHIGFVLDGNRRWAKERGLPTLKGHREMTTRLREVTNEAFDLGIKNLSAFMFSTENWNRSKEEVSYLIDLYTGFIASFARDLKEREVRFVFAGSRLGLPKSLLDVIDFAVADTKSFKHQSFVACINYGGQQEIVDAAKKLLRERFNPDNLTAKTLTKYLYAPDLPPLDAIVRTSGEHRLSGFMMYRAAYAEYIFVDKYWPDFTKQDLNVVLAYYAKRQRRFGK